LGQGQDHRLGADRAGGRLDLGPGGVGAAEADVVGHRGPTHRQSWRTGKLRWCTERRRLVVEFWLALANAAIVCGRLVGRAWIRYCWDGRPRRRP
jgi:hypothetical protein